MAAMRVTAQLAGRTVRSLKVERIAQELTDVADARCRCCGESLTGEPHPVGGRHLRGCRYVAPELDLSERPRSRRAA